MVELVEDSTAQEETLQKSVAEPATNGVHHDETDKPEGTNGVSVEAESTTVEAEDATGAEEAETLEETIELSKDQQDTNSAAPEAPASEEPASISSPEKSAVRAPRREERKRLWFVRMPKPPDTVAAADEPANLEIESLNTTISFLNESLGVKRMERERATEAVQAARADFDAIKQQCDALKAVADPVRAERKQLRDNYNTLQAEFKADYSDLPARSEEELASKIKALQQEYEHGTFTSLAQEKQTMIQIRKLESLTQKVKEYGDKQAAVREAQAAVKAAVQGSEETEADLTNLYEELTVQRAILDKYRTEETRLKGEYKAAQDEKQRVWQQLQDLRGRIRAEKNEKYSRGRVWGDNRKFSQQIRLVLAKGEGALAEGKRLCNEQMDKALEQLASDAEFRAEYFELWSGQRTHPISAYEDLDDLNTPAGKRDAGTAAAAAAAAEAAAKDRAKKQIADILAQQAEVAKGRAAEAARATEEAEKAAAAATAASSPEGEASPADAAASAAAAAVGNAPAAAAVKKPQRKGSKSVAAPVVLLPEVADDPFELPSAALKRAPAPDAEEEKQRIREQNRAAAAEAEKRKERQRKAADEKRKAAEARRLKLEQEKAAAEKAEKERTASPAATSPPAPSSETDAPAATAAAASAVGAAAADVASAAVAQGKQLVDEAAVKVKSGTGGGGAPKRVALQKEQPRARAVVRKRNVAAKSLQKASQKISVAANVAVEQYWPWARDNAALAALIWAGAVLLLGIVLMLVLSR